MRSSVPEHFSQTTGSDGLSPQMNGSSHRANTFSLSSLFACTSLLAFLLGAWRLSPVLGILLVIWFVPAFGRAVYVIYAWERAGHRTTLGDKIVEFIASLSILFFVSLLTVIGTIAVIAMAIIFFAIADIMWPREHGAVLGWLTVVGALGLFAFLVYALRPSQFDGPNAPSADPFARRDQETASLRRSRAEIMP